MIDEVLLSDVQALEFAKAFMQKYGDIECITTDSIDGHVCEMMYRSAKTKECVGYWAYGHYDPEYEYRGQRYIKVVYPRF